MIDFISLSQFKRFSYHRFDFPLLTILTGTNGTGKSSVIQALLLARQASARSDGLVELNGPFGLELGSFGDIINDTTAEKIAKISVGFDGHQPETWMLSGNDSHLYANVSSTNKLDGTDCFGLHRAFQYLAAERLGPRIYNQANSVPSSMIEVGSKGEYSAQVFEVLGSMTVDQARVCHPAEESAALVKVQCERWLSRMTRELQIDSRAMKEAGLFTLRFRTGSGWVKPTNMGFGVTYALPVILAGLTAAPGGLLIVENPEAHLHPAAQSYMGTFLATMASSGVQILIESHSDHLLNGIRRAIGEQGLLSPENAAVYHFDTNHDVIPLRLDFTVRGGVSSWPKSFFDQYQIDVAALTRVSKRPR